MLIGSLDSVDFNPEQFINQNELILRRMFRQAMNFIPRDDYSSDDDWNECLAAAVISKLCEGECEFDGAINLETINSFDQNFLKSFAEMLIVFRCLWIMQDNNLVELDEKGMYKLKEGPKPS